ncbi:MAG: hypothetical protein R6U66_13970 [Bacteroidales bacterium]
MIDLDKLDKEIDELFEQETSDSLTKWLLNKRLGDYTKLLGNGSFINMQSKNQPIFSCKQKANFNSEDNFLPTSPTNRKAA